MSGRLTAPVLAAASLPLASCYPSPGDPVAIPGPPAPFLRAPYLQDVGASEASVLWMSESAIEGDTLWFRPATPDSVPFRAELPADRGRGVRLARLEGLPAGGLVEYAVGVGPERFGPWRFRTAPPPGAGDSIRVLLFGDSGWGREPQIALAGAMTASGWDLAIHVGDIAYNDGAEDEFTRRHFRVYREMLAEVPLFPAVGNHDVRADGGRSYDRAFDWPGPDDSRRWYSFRWGPVAFVAVDTSSPTEAVRGLRRGEGPQYEWLERTLRAAAEDSAVAWTVVYQHHPLYSHAVGVSGHGQDRGLGRALAPLYERYGVDLVAAGHDHHYERSVPIRDGRAVEPGCGPVYLVQGAGGSPMYARDVASSPLQASRARTFSFTRLVIRSDRIDGRTGDAEGGVLDEFVVHPCAGPSAPGCRS